MIAAQEVSVNDKGFKLSSLINIHMHAKSDRHYADRQIDPKRLRGVRRPRNWQLVVLVQTMILALLLLIAILFSLFGGHPEGFIYPLCVILLILFAWTLWSWREITGNLFDPYILFIIAAFTFNAGLAFLEVFHLNKGGIFNGLFSQQIILETLLLVAISLMAFHSGALVAVFLRDRKAGPSRATREQVQDGRSLRLVGWAMIGVAAIPTVLILMKSISLVTLYGYPGLFQQETSTGFGAWENVLSAFLVPGVLFLLAGSKGKRSGIFMSLGIILAYCGVLFFLGRRSFAIMPLLAYLWLWHRCIRKIPMAAMVVIAILLIVVLVPSLAVFRGVKGQERYSWTAFAGAYESVNNRFVAGLSEMGGTMQTVSYTIDMVPKIRGYDMGLGYCYALLTVVPNIFWSVHPTIARGVASEWLVKIRPGLGYSFIAEAYLNFGRWGTPIVLGLMGFLFGKLVLWGDRSGDIARLALLASFLSFVLFFARGESSFSVFRALAWYSVLPYLAVRLLGFARNPDTTRTVGLPAGS